MADVVVETAQHLLAAVQLGHLRAQAVEDRRELAGDVAAADHQQPAREGLEVEHLFEVTTMFAPGKIRNVRPAAGGDQDVPRGNADSRRRCD